MGERDTTAGGDSAAIAEANAMDAAGRHDDAIKVLSRAAAAGDAGAKRTVGARIMIGDRAPHLGPQGAGLIIEAAAEGDARAAAICAVLAGMGAYRPQSWSASLDYLLAAAERGDTEAQGQLRVLAGEPDSGDWAGLRRRISIEALLAAPEPHVLSADPRIVIYPAFAEPGICAWLTRRAEGRLKRALVYDPVGKFDKPDEWRTNTTAIFTLADCDLVQIVLQARIARAAGFPFAHLEATSVLHYEPGQAFDDHYDFVDPEAPNYAQEIARHGQRLATFLVYLNEDYTGGETAFPRLGFSHHGAAGEGLMFANALRDGAPDIRTLHAGRAPATGEKWVVSQWLRSRPIAPGISPSWRP